MHLRLHWLIACLLICVITCDRRALALPNAPTPRVILETGTIEGTHFGSAQNDVAFLGVPYAAPPVGNLRWKPPQPVMKGAGRATRRNSARPVRSFRQAGSRILLGAKTVST